MTVCRFWRQGNCRFGDTCKFEHPPGFAQNQGQNQNRNQSQNQNQNRNQNQNQPRNQNNHQDFGQFQNRVQNNNSDFNQGRGNNQNQNQNQNRFDTFRSSSNQSNASNRHNQHHGRAGQQSTRDPYGITVTSLREDLRNERPQWIMSAYGPGKDAPVQLFGGYPLEQSFEEIRMQHYLAIASGNVQQSIAHEGELATQANQQVENALKDIRGAIQYIQNGINTHPNRLDICAANSSGSMAMESSNQQNTFQTQPSVVQTTAVPLNQPQLGGFGQNSALPMEHIKSIHNSMQNPVPNAFNSPAAVTGFVPQQPPPNFGTPVNPLTQVNNFGQPVGSFSSSNGFAQDPTANGNQLFGNQGPVTGGDGFGNGTPVYNTPFGQTNGPFGNGAFSKQTPPISAPNFTSQQTNSATIDLAASHSDGFKQSVDVSTTDEVKSNFNAQSLPAEPPSGGYNKDLNSYSTRDASNKLLTWKGRPVQYQAEKPYYQRNNGGWERIWFPDGEPAGAAASQIQNQNKTRPEVATVYEYLHRNGKFRDGIIPEIPPLSSWTAWDI